MRIYSLSVFEQYISERRDTEEVSSEKRNVLVLWETQKF